MNKKDYNPHKNRLEKINRVIEVWEEKLRRLRLGGYRDPLYGVERRIEKRIKVNLLKRSLQEMKINFFYQRKEIKDQIDALEKELREQYGYVVE